MEIMAMGRLYEHMAERLTKWGGLTIVLILYSITNLIMDGKMLWYPIISTSNFRDAPNAVWLRRQPDVQSVHLPVHQLLLVDHLHRLLQGQVRRLPRSLPQHHGQQPQKWRRKKAQSWRNGGDSDISSLIVWERWLPYRTGPAASRHYDRWVSSESLWSTKLWGSSRLKPCLQIFLNFTLPQNSNHGQTNLRQPGFY